MSAEIEPEGTGKVDDPDEPQGPSGGSVEKVYGEPYVTKLRDEAAAYRVRAKRAEDAETRLRELAIAQAVSGILTDPTDLGWDPAYADDEGWPDAAKIRRAAEELIDRKPHLGRPSGDVGQGQHSDEDGAPNLWSMLRAGT